MAKSLISLPDYSHLSDHPQHGRVKGIVQIGDLLIHPVGSHHILNQIVRPDAEKVNFPGQLIRNHCRRRHLDHDADFQFIIIR